MAEFITTKKSRHIIVESLSDVSNYGKIDSMNDYGFEKVAICSLIKDKFEQETMNTIPVDKKYWNRKEEWIYLIVADGFIIKAGGTTDGISGRFGSYRAGTVKNRIKGTCSVTNYVVQQSILNLIRKGHTVEIWGFHIPEIKEEINLFGKIKNVKVSVFKEYERKIFSILEKKFGSRPMLSLN